jgi:hypothetical protein
MNKLTIEQRKQALIENRTKQQKMSDKEYDNAPWEDCPLIAREVGNSKITSRFWERRYANMLGWTTNPKSTDGRDYGDLMPTNGVIGIDNIELKTTEVYGNYNIGGGQLRFYENIPWYMFSVLDDNFQAHTYVMHKDDIYNEIFIYGKGIGSVSQGSGKTRHSDGTKFSKQEKLDLMNETFKGNNDILWGFGINGKRDTKTKKSWDKKYKVSIEDLQDWDTFKKKRNK